MDGSVASSLSLESYILTNIDTTNEPEITFLKKYYSCALLILILFVEKRLNGVQ